uniref:Photosystem II protein L n=1 Tax=Cyclocodon parviflorus TaxID=2851912 RepID=A0A8F3FJB2_9ASTR|nr:photosystem II protein L [Cyclocodon parviflorus]
MYLLFYFPIISSIKKTKENNRIISLGILSLSPLGRISSHNYP